MSVEGIKSLVDWLWELALTTVKKLLCMGWPYGAGFASVGLWFLPVLPFVCIVFEGCQWIPWLGPKMATRHVSPEASEMAFAAGQVQQQSISCSGPPAMSPKAIHRWAGLQAVSRVQTTHQGWLLLVLSSGLLNMRYRTQESQITSGLGFMNLWDILVKVHSMPQDKPFV